MYQHKYDESGLSSSFLMLTLVVPIALYKTYAMYKNRSQTHCSCKKCARNSNHSSKRGIIFTALLWVLVSYLVRNILTIPMEAKSDSLFNPFSVLKVDETASAEQIKKSYKKLLKPFSRKLNRKEFKAEAQENIKLLNKAFNILKDEKSYQIWIKSDNKKESAFAIPSFILKFSVHSFIVYIALLCTVIPYYIYKSYRKYRYQSPLGCLFKSSEDFLDQIDTFSDNDQVLIVQLLLFISNTEDFKNYNFSRNLRDETIDGMSYKRIIESRFADPLVSDEQGYLHLMDYLHRTSLSSPKDSEYVRKTSLALVEAFVRAAVHKKKTKLLENLLVLEKMINQAVFSPEYHLLQYPSVSFEKICGESFKKSITSDKKYLSDNVHCKESLNILQNIPIIEIKDLKAYTVNTSSSNFDDELIPIVERENEMFKIEKGSTPTVSLNLVKKAGSKVCHTPYSRELVKNKWRVYCKVNGEVFQDVFVLEDFDDSKAVKFTLPAGNIKDDVRICVVSSGYFSADAEAQLFIKYQ